MYQSDWRSCLQLCLPVLSEKVNDVQRGSIDQPDSQMKGCLPVFLKQKAVTPLGKRDDCAEGEEQGRRNLCTDMSIRQRYGLHQVHSLGVNLDEGEDVPSLHSVAQRVEPRGRVGTLLPSESLLGVLGSDEILPGLPDGMMYSIFICSLKLKKKCNYSLSPSLNI